MFNPDPQTHNNVFPIIQPPTSPCPSPIAYSQAFTKNMDHSSFPQGLFTGVKRKLQMLLYVRACVRACVCTGHYHSHLEQARKLSLLCV